MKLLLLRHAKSSWGDPSLRDEERPLNARGERAATLVGAWLAQQDLEPDLVLCSPALRTRETWARVAPQLSATPEIRVDEALYGASARQLLDAIRSGRRAGTLLVLAHNPGISELAELLSGDGDPGALDRLPAGLPTGGLAELELSGPWAEVAPRSARLERLVRPKELV